MRIPLARDGYRFIAPAAIATAVLAWLGWWPLAALMGGATLFLLYFFRDFERVTPRIEDAVFAAGDGRVDDIEEVAMADFPDGRALKVGVFLSLFNCHITRSPVRGRVVKVDYCPGKFHNAMARESSTENERNSILLDADGLPVMARQIAGVIARRIVCSARTGQRVEAGERVGLIRMGSRLEVYLPVNAELRVKKGATVHAGISLLAILRRAPGSAASSAGGGA